jgi:putative copper resistance protein D
MRKNPPCLVVQPSGPAYDSDLMRHAARAPVAVAAVLVSIMACTVAITGPALAHGEAPTEPTVETVWTAWSFEADVWLPILLAGLAWSAAVRRVDWLHPGNPVPRLRSVAWLAGLGVTVLALGSPIERYDTTLFSVHMLQHLLLTMVAAPLLVLAAPVTLLLRFATPEARRRWILPVLHSRVLRAVTHPLVAWLLFAGTMWATHFSPLFDAALEDPLVHRLEHALFVVAALLFWWPAVGADPAPRRLGHPGRILYLGLGMPWSSFLALAIFSSSTVLYEHYATIERDWGMSPLEDQAWAGGIMWAGGDLIFLVTLILAVMAWLGAEEREGRRLDARLDVQRRRAVAPPSGAAHEGGPG